MSRRLAIAISCLLFMVLSAPSLAASRPAPAMARAAAIADKPTAGAPFSIVKISGGGFAAGEKVLFYYGVAKGTPVGAVTAASSGAIRGSLRIPATAHPGLSQIYAVGAKSKRTAHVAFTMRPIALIVIKETSGNTFSPSKVAIPLDATVKWVNVSSVSHTTTWVSGPNRWNSGTMAPHAVFFFSFGMAGTNHYQCQFHAILGMKGVIVVK